MVVKGSEHSKSPTGSRSMELSFSIRQWAAWAPGLDRRDDWQTWAGSPVLPVGDDVPTLEEVPAMQRRRLSRLGRAVFHVTARAADAHAELPMVFASRYGDVDRALHAIGTLEDGEPLSPTVFAGSVHNAIGALYSIVGGQRQNMVCVAAGATSAAAGLVEAAALLADGAYEVLLACYDEPLPPPYATFADEPQALYAWAWRIAAPRPGAPSLHLARTADASAAHEAATLPAGLEPMRWLLGTPSTLVQRDGAMVWRWSRDA